MAKQKFKNNLKTMNAKAELYGNKVTPISALRVIISYEIGIIAFALLLYGTKQFLMVGIIVVIGAIFVYRSILPYKVDDVYRERGEAERSQFMHLVTQGMSAKEADILAVMQHAAKVAKGEFYDDIIHVIIRMQQSHQYDVYHPAFKKVTNKYKDDIFFVMFMEQCETTFAEAQYDIRSFRSFQVSHDSMMAAERNFLKSKQQYQTNLFVLFFVEWVVLAMILFSQGFKSYLTTWITPFGFVVSTITFICFAFCLRKFYKRYYDNNVMEE